VDFGDELEPMGKELQKVGFKIGFNKRPPRRNSRRSDGQAEFRMNSILLDRELRNQQVAGSSPAYDLVLWILLAMARIVSRLDLIWTLCLRPEGTARERSAA
jgi:hypothetical protein